MADTPPSGTATGPTDPGTTLTGPDAAPLRRVQTVARLMDDAFGIPGTDVRIGLDPILGVLPVVGDSVAMLFSLYVVLEGARAGVPRGTLVEMLVLVGIDAVIGSVPLLGPLFDTFWKANSWNVATIERHVEGS